MDQMYLGKLAGIMRDDGVIKTVLVERGLTLLRLRDCASVVGRLRMADSVFD